MDMLPVSKVLVLGASPAEVDLIDRFCAAHRLLPLHASVDKLNDTLDRYFDLGGVLLSQADGLAEDARLELMVDVRRRRNDVPLIMHCDSAESLAALSDATRAIVSGCWIGDDTAQLALLVQQHVFIVEYPRELVNNIEEASTRAIESVFWPLQAIAEPPRVVRDNVVFGELFSLIPLESAWCRGYLMLQAEEGPLMRFMQRHRPTDTEHDFHSVNGILNEVTNLVWGMFKARFGVGALENLTADPIQVPLIIHHGQRFMSFGAAIPQLCFPYTLVDTETGDEVHIMERFAFNLGWTPERFEPPSEAAKQLNNGEVEMF